VVDPAPKTWVLTGSPENFAATRERGFEVIGLKERRRAFAEQIAVGDRIVLYVTKVKAFGASIRVTGELFEDRTKLWPGKPGKADAYPWRFPTEPELVLDETEWVPAEELVDELEHIRRWPRACDPAARRRRTRRRRGSAPGTPASSARAAAGVRA
jgi:hypothetical protein